MFEVTGMDYLLSPFERQGIFVVGLGEGVYGPAYIPDGVGAQVMERLPPQYAEPAFHLVEP